MTVDSSQRCGVCRSYMDDEDLFCANCGTENPSADCGVEQLAHATSHHSFDCESCGASMSYDASAQALRCPFCGSTEMRRRDSVRTIQSDWVVPLQLNAGQAESIFRNWLRQGFWRPADASRASSIGKIAAVYVPYWVFEATADTMWTADSSPAPPGSRGDWYPVSGKNRSTYTDVLVGGSSILVPRETASITPFRLADAVAPSQVDLDNAIVETFKVPRKLARPLARAAIEELERTTCSRYVPGRARNLKVNVRVEGMRGRPVLLPVWILAYRYKNDVHRVLINGQTGKIAGSTPFAYGKLTMLLLVIAFILALIVLIGILSR